MKNTTSLDIHNALFRIANRIKNGTSPSRQKISRDLGKVVLAIQNDIPIDIESDPEGILAVPKAEVLSALNSWLNAKYTLDIIYRNFGARIRGPWRDSLVEHWTEHSGDERKNAYDIAMKIIGLGGDPIQAGFQIPPAPANLEAFFKIIMKLEQNSIATGRKIIKMSGENTALKVLAENIVLIDSHHLDDLIRMSVIFDSGV